jgi:hypothetical protein
MRWMTYSRTFSWRPDRRGVPKSLSQKDLLLSATFALAFLSSSPLYRGFLPEERKFRQGGRREPTLEGGLPLFTSGREEVFSETRIHPAESLCNRTGPKPSFGPVRLERFHKMLWHRIKMQGSAL